VLRVCARDARQHPPPPVRESEIRAVDRGLRETETGFGLATNEMGRIRAADSTVSDCRSMGKTHVRAMWHIGRAPRRAIGSVQVESREPNDATGDSDPRVVEGGGAMVVHDVQGPIVTGVLGGDW